MWLPGPVYESLPYAYVTGGALFVVGTLYAQPGAAMTAVYLVAGGISLGIGGLVYARRRAARSHRPRRE